MDEKSPQSVLRETDQEAVTLAKRLLREARYASLATLEPETGHPLASRVTIATQMDGTPLILVSSLSTHTPALLADNRCSLLIGQIGKGDPLAHARMTVVCHAVQLARTGSDHVQARRRFLARHPKAELYVDFGDFSFFRLDVERISLNGGFGKAYALSKSDLIIADDLPYDDFLDIEPGVIAHMNEDHRDNINDYAAFFGGKNTMNWEMTGLDPEGIDLVANDESLRVAFSRTLLKPEEIRPILVTMAKSAKAARE